MERMLKSTMLATGALLALGFFTTVNASPMDATKIPGDVDWYAHVNIEKLRSSEVGVGIISLLREAIPLDKLAEAEDLALSRLKGVTACGYKDHEGVTLIFHGELSKAEWKRALNGNVKYRTQKFRGVDVLTPIKKAAGKKAGEQYLAFPGKSLVVSSDELDTLVHALSVLDGRFDSIAPEDKAFGDDDALLEAWANIEALEDIDEASQVLARSNEARIVAKEKGPRFILGVVIDGKTVKDAVLTTKILDGVPAIIELMAMCEKVQLTDKKVPLTNEEWRKEEAKRIDGVIKRIDGVIKRENEETKKMEKEVKELNEKAKKLNEKAKKLNEETKEMEKEWEEKLKRMSRMERLEFEWLDASLKEADYPENSSIVAASIEEVNTKTDEIKKLLITQNSEKADEMFQKIWKLSEETNRALNARSQDITGEAQELNETLREMDEAIQKAKETLGLISGDVNNDMEAPVEVEHANSNLEVADSLKIESNVERTGQTVHARYSIKSTQLLKLLKSLISDL